MVRISSFTLHGNQQLLEWYDHTIIGHLQCSRQDINYVRAAQLKCPIRLMQEGDHSVRQASRVTSMYWWIETGKFAPGKEKSINSPTEFFFV